jgi:hypothetical protein
VKKTPLPRFKPRMLTRENCRVSTDSEESFSPGSPQQTQTIKEPPTSPRFPSRNRKCSGENNPEPEWPTGYQYTPSQELKKELQQLQNEANLSSIEFQEELLPGDDQRAWCTTSASYSPATRCKEEPSQSQETYSPTSRIKEEPCQLQETKSENYSPTTRVKEEPRRTSSVSTRASDTPDYWPTDDSQTAFDPYYYEDEEAYNDSIQRFEYILQNHQCTIFFIYHFF